jgi:Sensors of blue-light using FAD
MRRPIVRTRVLAGSPPTDFLLRTLLADGYDMNSELIHCIYASAASREFDVGELADLLDAARENNARLGLTGMLLYSEGSFFQVLEGQADVVDALCAKIERDPRHGRMTVIIREPIAKRYFDAWTMGFYRVSREELAGMSGANDFFCKDGSAVPVEAGRAKKLLLAFREGRWRKRLSGAGLTAPA